MSGVRCAQISGRRQGGSHGHTGKRSGRIPSGGPRGRLRVEREGQHVVVTGTGELVNAVILALHAAGVTARDMQLDSSNRGRLRQAHRKEPVFGPTPLLVLAGYTLVFAYLARRFFRWE